MPCRRPGVARCRSERALLTSLVGEDTEHYANEHATLHAHVHTPTAMPTEYTVQTHDTQRRQPVSLPVECPRTIYARVALLSFACVRLVLMPKSGGGFSGACARNSLCIGQELKSACDAPGCPGRPVQTRQMMVQGS